MKTLVVVVLVAFVAGATAQTFQRLGTCPSLGCIFPPDQTDFLPGQACFSTLPPNTTSEAITSTSMSVLRYTLRPMVPKPTTMVHQMRSSPSASRRATTASAPTRHNFSTKKSRYSRSGLSSEGECDLTSSTLLKVCHLAITKTSLPKMLAMRPQSMLLQRPIVQYVFPAM